MAGIYPNSPSRRMAWDADGTLFMLAIGGGFDNFSLSTPPDRPWVEDSVGDKEFFNNELPSTKNSTSNVHWFGWAFPEKRDIDALGFNISDTSGFWSDTSDDTTNGIDGTWASTGYSAFDSDAHISYRTTIGTVSASAVLFLRSFHKAFMQERWMHVYGSIAAGETPDRIIFLDTLNADAEFTVPIDYEEVPQGQTQQRTIKLKNNSTTKSIEGVVLSAEDLYLNAGGWYQFSDDDLVYSTSLSVGTMTSSSTQLVYVKQIVPAAETLGLQAARLKATHTAVT